jgi:hypothetical protein
LALYLDDKAFLATFRKPTLLVNYLESYLTKLQQWLMEWTIAINVSKSSAINFARAGRRFIQSRPVTHIVEPIKLVETTRYLVVTLIKRLTWSPQFEQFRRLTAQIMCLQVPLLNKKCDLSVRIGVLLFAHLVRP